MADCKNCLHYWICKSNTKGSLVSIFLAKEPQSVFTLPTTPNTYTCRVK